MTAHLTGQLTGPLVLAVTGAVERTVTWANVVDAVAAAGPFAFVPLVFVVAFVLRLERWYRVAPRVLGALADRIASIRAQDRADGDAPGGPGDGAGGEDR